MFAGYKIKIEEWEQLWVYELGGLGGKRINYNEPKPGLRKSCEAAFKQNWRQKRQNKKQQIFV